MKKHKHNKNCLNVMAMKEFCKVMLQASIDAYDQDLLFGPNPQDHVLKIGKAILENQKLVHKKPKAKKK